MIRGVLSSGREGGRGRRQGKPAGKAARKAMGKVMGKACACALTAEKAGEEGIGVEKTCHGLSFCLFVVLFTDERVAVRVEALELFR